jgi:hypothetical protein
MDYFKFISDVGFPIVSALTAGWFVFITLKFILSRVISSIHGMINIITGLNERVKTMNTDIIRIDTLVSAALGLQQDVDRIARITDKSELRKD